MTRDGLKSAHAVVALLLPLLLTVPAAAKDTIHWILYPAFPPARIATGPLAGQGITDRQIDWLTTQLDGFDHVLVEGSNA